jgi:hypothetical protein
VNPELQTHVPATREAFGLHVWQVEAVPRQVRQLAEQAEHIPNESRKNPFEHLQIPPSRNALESLQPKHWLNERPLQVVHEAWHWEQNPFVSKANPELQKQLTPFRLALRRQEVQAFGSLVLQVLHLLKQLLQFPFESIKYPVVQTHEPPLIEAFILQDVH